MAGILQDRVAVVTGAAQGLGQAICVRLANEGCHVIAADLNEKAAQETAALVCATGRKGLAQKVDVSQEAQVEALFKLATDTFGKLDVCVANAGVLISDDITAFDAEKWRVVMNVNLFGYFLTAKHALKIMKAQRRGSLIQINSKSGKKGSFKNSAYAASKFGGIGFTQSIALEMAEHGVRCNAICPGNLLDSPLWVNSLYKQYAKNQGITEEQVRQKYIDQVPMKRGCTYDDVCNVLVFLASDASSYMTGQAINVTGGQEMR